MKPKALILAPFDERYIERLRRRLAVTYEPWTETRTIQNPPKLAERLAAEKTAFIVVEADFLQEAAFATPGLRAAGVCRNALNLIDLNAATRHGVPVIHTPNRNTTAVAELAIAFMIAITRQVVAAHNWVREGSWTNPIDAYIRWRGREIAGSTVGVVGLGRIGSEVAEKVRALGAKVIAHDPYVPREHARALGARLRSLPRLLREADFVTLHTSLTGSENLIDAPQLDEMRPDAYLISTGAGNAVNIDALVERLRDRRIAGAALDVYPGHMLPTTSPLMQLDNVILTPHIGGATAESVERHSRMITEDIERFLDGKRPRHVVNPDALKARRRR